MNKPTALIATTHDGFARVWFQPTISDEDKKHLVALSIWKGIDASDPHCGTVGVEVSNGCSMLLPALVPNLHFTNNAKEAMKAWGV
jgi:hypothetical protein